MNVLILLALRKAILLPNVSLERKGNIAMIDLQHNELVMKPLGKSLNNRYIYKSIHSIGITMARISLQVVNTTNIAASKNIWIWTNVK